MKITKYVHSCLLVETADRVALFDPGAMSSPTITLDSLDRLDDIFITHIHGDHVDADFLKRVLAKFPAVRITSTNEVVSHLAGQGIKASTTPPAGAELFESPHEKVEPLFPQPEATGFHYLDQLSHPGDSHSFTGTKPILALPVTAPWGATIKAVNLAIELKPKHVIPIHDWHWNDQARQMMYGLIAEQLEKRGITFHKMETGNAIEIDL